MKPTNTPTNSPTEPTESPTTSPTEEPTLDPTCITLKLTVSDYLEEGTAITTNNGYYTKQNYQLNENEVWHNRNDISTPESETAVRIYRDDGKQWKIEVMEDDINVINWASAVGSELVA